MNVCLIPCYRRPEFLREVLLNITLAERADELLYVFRLDHGFDPTCLAELKDFPFRYRISYVARTQYTTTKQSWCVLSGLLECAELGELVYLVEDDVIIGRDFFRWHEAAHKRELFSSHANLNINTEQREGRHDEAYLTTNAYGSIGTCLPSKVIRNLICPHIDNRYLKAPIPYIRRTFPESNLSDSFSEQDGLIRRIQARTDLRQAYPCHQYIEGILTGPRAYHAGFVGKNRKQTTLHGNLDTRRKRVQETIYDPERMKTECQEYWRDSVPCAIQLPEWHNLNWIS